MDERIGQRSRYADHFLTYQRLFVVNRRVRAALYFPLMHAWREVKSAETGCVGAAIHHHEDQHAVRRAAAPENRRNVLR
jgi:hypothetical protein